MFWKKSQKFIKICKKSSCWVAFTVKLQPAIAYKRLLGQLYQTKDAYTETLTQVISVNFEKKLWAQLLNLCETAFKIMSNKKFFTFNLAMFFQKWFNARIGCSQETEHTLYNYIMYTKIRKKQVVIHNQIIGCPNINLNVPKNVSLLPCRATPSAT